VRRDVWAVTVSKNFDQLDARTVATICVMRSSSSFSNKGFARAQGCPESNAFCSGLGLWTGEALVGSIYSSSPLLMISLHNNMLHAHEGACSLTERSWGGYTAASGITPGFTAPYVAWLKAVPNVLHASIPHCCMPMKVPALQQNSSGEGTKLQAVSHPISRHRLLRG
jgi:hypothetical protein